MTISSADHPPTTITFDWTYSNGVVTTSSASDPSLNNFAFNVGAGGRVMTHATANHADNTDVLVILTRLQ